MSSRNEQYANINVDEYSNARFKQYQEKPGSAIDEKLFDRVTAILDCQDKDKKNYKALDINNKGNSIKCVKPDDEIFMYEHFNGTKSDNTYMYWIVALIVIIIIVLLFRK